MAASFEVAAAAFLTRDDIAGILLARGPDAVPDATNGALSLVSYSSNNDGSTLASSKRLRDGDDDALQSSSSTHHLCVIVGVADIPPAQPMSRQQIVDELLAADDEQANIAVVERGATAGAGNSLRVNAVKLSFIVSDHMGTRRVATLRSLSNDRRLFTAKQYQSFLNHVVVKAGNSMQASHVAHQKNPFLSIAHFFETEALLRVKRRLVQISATSNEENNGGRGNASLLLPASVTTVTLGELIAAADRRRSIARLQMQQQKQHRSNNSMHDTSVTLANESNPSSNFSSLSNDDLTALFTMLESLTEERDRYFDQVKARDDIILNRSQEHFEEIARYKQAFAQKESQLSKKIEVQSEEYKKLRQEQTEWLEDSEAVAATFEALKSKHKLIMEAGRHVLMTIGQMSDTDIEKASGQSKSEKIAAALRALAEQHQK